MASSPSLPIKRLKDGRWQLYIARSFTGTGKPRRPSFPTRAEAQRYRERVLAGHRIIEMHKTVDAGDLTDASRAKEILLRAGVEEVSMVELARFYCTHRGASKVSVSEAFADYWEARASHRRERYRAEVQGYLRRMEERLGPETPLVMVTPEQIEGAIVSAWPGASGARFNKIRATLAPVWKFARQKGWLEVDPFTRIGRREHKKSDTLIYTIAQVEALLRCTEPHNRAYWSLALFAGIRPAELLRLSWSDVNLPERRLMIRRDVSKTHKPRMVDLSENLVRILEKLNGEPLVPKVNTRKLIEAPRKRAELVGLGGDIARHTFASYHLALHNDLDLLRRNMGHETPNLVLTHYYDLVDRADAEAFWSIKID